MWFFEPYALCQWISIKPLDYPSFLFNKLFSPVSTWIQSIFMIMYTEQSLIICNCYAVIDSIEKEMKYFEIKI